MLLTVLATAGAVYWIMSKLEPARSVHPLRPKSSYPRIHGEFNDNSAHHMSYSDHAAVHSDDFTQGGFRDGKFFDISTNSY